MPVFDQYPQGTPCWIDLATSDANAGKAFYSSVFGWEYEDNTMDQGVYTFAKLNGQKVAAISGMTPEMAATMSPVWTTYLAVDDIDDAVAKATEAGGTVMMRAQEIPDAGHMAYISDPTGAAVGLWQAGNHIGATLANEPGTFIWNECFTDDVPKAAAFYASVLGTGQTTTDMGGPVPYTALMVNDASVGGFMHRDPVEHKDVPNCWLVYFATADINETVTKINAGGGTILNGPFDTPVGPMIVAQDPQGAVFQAMQPAQ